MPMVAVNGIECPGITRHSVDLCGTGEPLRCDRVGRVDVDAAGSGRSPTTIAVFDRPKYRNRLTRCRTSSTNANRCHRALRCRTVPSRRSLAWREHRLLGGTSADSDLVTSAVLLVGGGNFRPHTAEEMANSLDAYRQGGEAAQNVQREGLFDAMLTTAQRHDDRGPSSGRADHRDARKLLGRLVRGDRAGLGQHGMGGP